MALLPPLLACTAATGDVLSLGAFLASSLLIVIFLLLGLCAMSEEKLVHRTDIELHGDLYQIMVFCREDGRHFAKTFFAEDDIIINDGATLEEVLVKHQRLLPLAISSRKILQDFRGGPRKRVSRP